MGKPAHETSKELDWFGDLHPTWKIFHNLVGFPFVISTAVHDDLGFFLDKLESGVLVPTNGVLVLEVPNLELLSEEDRHDFRLSQLEKTMVFGDKMFKLVATVNGNGNHFNAWLRMPNDDNRWCHYDGMNSPMMNLVRKDMLDDFEEDNFSSYKICSLVLLEVKTRVRRKRDFCEVITSSDEEDKSGDQSSDEKGVKRDEIRSELDIMSKTAKLPRKKKAPPAKNYFSSSSEDEITKELKTIMAKKSVAAKPPRKKKAPPAVASVLTRNYFSSSSEDEELEKQSYDEKGVSRNEITKN